MSLDPQQLYATLEPAQQLNGTLELTQQLNGTLAQTGPPGPTGSQGPPMAVQDEGTTLTAFNTINFTGSGVTAAVDTVNDRINVTIPGGGTGSGGHVIQDEGAALPQRASINFVGNGVMATDDAANDRTAVTIVAVAGPPGEQGIPGEPGADSTLPGPPGPAGADSTVPGPAGPAGADSTVPGPQGIQGIPGLPNVVQDEGTPLTPRAALNFVGAGVTATDDGTRTVVTIPGGGAGGGHVIQEEGTPLTQRAGLNFAGAGVIATDDSANDRTIVTIAGGGGSQTPWTSDINGAGFSLLQAGQVGPAAVSLGTDYLTASILVRETLRTGSGSGTTATYTPRMAFYWFGQNAVQIGYDTAATPDGVRTFDAAGTAYAPFAAALIESKSGGFKFPDTTTQTTAAVNPAANVTSVFTRTGAVVAQANDYTAAQITNAVSTLGSYADPAWITSLAYSKLTGVPSTFAPSAHVHAGTDITTGLVAVARLGTGTPSAANFLRGDGAWEAVSGGSVGGSTTQQDGHTWALVGDVTSITTLPSMFVPLLGAQVGTLAGIRCKIDSGTSVGVQVKRNGSNVGSVITVTTTATTTALGPVTLANGDELTLVLSSPVGTPSFLSATLILEGTAGGAHVIQEEGAPLTQRTALNFVGAGVTVTDDSANDRTLVTIPGGGGGGAVDSVFGRTGVVVAASGDYTAAQVTNAVSTIGSYADPAWITSLAYSKLTGVPSTFAPSAHVHAAADITTGVMAVARLGTGTPSASNFLRGDGAWEVPAVGSQTPWTSDIDGGAFILNNAYARLHFIAVGIEHGTSPGPSIVVNGSGIGWNGPGINIGPLRWEISRGGDGIPESGSNTGSNLAFIRYGDAGVADPIGTVFSLNRQSGAATFNGTVFVNADVDITGAYKKNGTALKSRIGHTWGLVGDVSAITTLPSIFVPLVSPQTATLVALRADIASGTSIGVQVRRNGGNVGGVITVTTTAATTSLGNVALTDGDELTLVLSAPVGTPSHLGATLILEHTP